MLLSLFTNWWDEWQLYHKVTFDGDAKLIIVNADVDALSVRRDIYSSWKEWVLLGDHSKYDSAIRVTGGDPIGGGQFTGDVYFLINNWRIIVDHSCAIDGVIYSDDYPSPFVQVVGTQIVTNKVSSLVSVVAPTVIVDGGTIPSAATIAEAVWTALDRSLSVEQITAADVWNFLLSQPSTPGSAGEKLKQVLTTGNFLALK